MNPFEQAVHFHQTGALQKAEQLYRAVIQANPSHADAWCNLGAVLARQGRLDEAIACYRGILRTKPHYAEALFNLGNALRRKGQFADAVASYREAARLKPNQASFFYNLGLAHTDLDQLDDALACFQQTIRLDPAFAEAYNHLGYALLRTGRYVEAAARFEQFLRLQPQAPRGYLNLGLSLAAQSKPQEAAATFRQALQLQPDYAEAHNALGITLGELGEPDEALAHYEQAARLKPDYPDPLNNLGNSYREQARLDEAIACFRRALALQPRLAHVHSNLLLTLHYPADHDPPAVLAEARRWAQLHAEPLAAGRPSLLVDPTPNRRLRVGYVSADFRTHPVACYVEPLLAAHDRARFEVFCYANVPRPDAVTRRLQGLADHWFSLVGINDAAAAERIRQDRIDLLVDLAGHTAGNRLLLFARKPAPVQITYIGYPGTTGLSVMDYRISDADGDPPGLTERYYSEEIVRLPEVAWCYQPPGAPEVGDLPAVGVGHVTFGSFNNLAKVSPEVLAVWSRILRALPEARIHLLSGAGRQADQRLRDLFARQGISDDRVHLFPRQSRDSYLKLYAAVDVCLDPFPYHGCTTTCDALWMGVPVITLAGKAYVQRQAVVPLAHLGLHELIAASADEYVEAAIRLANDRARLHELREFLRPRMREATLTNPGRFMPALEQAYRGMWERWCAQSQTSVEAPRP